VKEKSGRWGAKTKESIPDEVIEKMDYLEKNPKIDWTIFYVQEVLWLVCRLYEDETMGEIVASKVMYSVEWKK
jgi:hypothetical protein